MKVLVITGDTKFGPGNPRYELQASSVEKLTVVYWGKGSVWPKIPHEKFDVVTAQDPFLRGLFAWKVAHRMGARFNVQVHADLSGQSFFKNILARFVLKRADSVRVVSDKLKRQVEKIGARAPTTVLPVFVDLERFQTIVPVPHEQKTILWTGRFESEKDPMLAIQIFREVCTDVDAKLIMLGQGSLANAVRQRTEAANAPIEFPGWQDTLPYLAKADVVLSTSSHESWGASIVEALAAGVPVVAPDVGIAREAGAIVVPREKLAAAVIDVLRTGVNGRLQLSLKSRADWARAWRDSL
jgi:glycosyltransferase involved in cell wall biosynthesis